MFKKINLIIISFFSVLSILLDVGFCLYIPIIFFYLLKDIKYIYYIIPTSFISILLLTRTSYLVPLGILLILVLFIIWIMNYLYKGYYMYIIVGLLNIITYLIIYKGIPSVTMFVVSICLSLLLYMYFERNLIDNISEKLYKETYAEMLIYIITITSASSVNIGNINLGYGVGIYLLMVSTISHSKINSLVLSIIVMIMEVVIFKVNAALFLPLIVAIYFLPFVYPVIIINIFSLTVILIDQSYPDEYMLIIMGVSLVFEIIKQIFVKKEMTNEAIRENIYTKVAKNVSEEVLGFAGFLDKFVEGFKVPKEYNERISEALKTIVQKHCMNCSLRKECFNKNKNIIYPNFKLLLFQKDLYSQDLREFLNYCKHSKEIYTTSKQLSYRFDFSTPGTNNNVMLSQIIGISNSIKKYASDIVSKEELKYEDIVKLKQELLDTGIDIVYYDVEKSFLDDFIIVIGVTNTNLSLIKNIEEISKNILKIPTSVYMDRNDNKVDYYKIIPKIIVDILYGSGSISSEGNHICGDNYIIKNLKNGKFVSAISDGMGKGYSAFYESDMTLKLVSDVVDLGIDTQTSLEILNTFYVIQDYLERYATLDLLEINRQNMQARFYKMGGTTTYILKNDGKIEKVVNRNLPFGIDELSEVYNYELENNDLILMSSDGIFENIIEEKDLEEFLYTIKDENPQKIVYELLNYTNKQKLKAKDDMTLIVLKVKMI